MGRLGIAIIPPMGDDEDKGKTSSSDGDTPDEEHAEESGIEESFDEFYDAMKIGDKSAARAAFHAVVEQIAMDCASEK